MDQEEIARLTQEYGGNFGLQHTLRLLHLVETIADGQPYHQEAVWLAAYMHDWGGYRAWAVEGVDHAVRSREVADQYLTEHGCPEDLKSLVLECIAHHHSNNPNRRLESVLLSDADALDFLGVTGLLRCFTMVPRDLRKAYEYAHYRRDTSNQVLQLPKSKELAGPLTEKMNQALESLEAETHGRF